MPKIDMKQARKFLSEISEKDKVAIIHHDDSDGFCSGILYYDWSKAKNADVQQFTYSIGSTRLKDWDLGGFNKIIICDLASGVIATELESIKDKIIFYTDHHPKEDMLPDTALELITTEQGYIPSSRTAGELTNLKPWLALVGTLADSGQYYKENDDFIEDGLKNVGMDLGKFQQEAVNTITNFLVYFGKNYEGAFGILEQVGSVDKISELKKYSEEVEKEVQKFVGRYEEEREMLGNVNFYYFEPHFSVKPPVCGRISDGDLEQIYIFASPKKSSEYITLSARNTSGKMNMVELLGAGTDGLGGSRSGGHSQAAGGIIRSGDIEKFKNNIKRFAEKRL